MSTDETKVTPAAAGSSESKGPEVARPEVSAQAVARMMGVATTTEIKLLEGKLDLLSGRISNMTVRLEKVVSQFNQLPSGSDLERIDVQIGSLKTMLREFIVGQGGNPAEGSIRPGAKEKKPTTTVVTADAPSSDAEAADIDEESQEAQP